MVEQSVEAAPAAGVDPKIVDQLRADLPSEKLLEAMSPDYAIQWIVARLKPLGIEDEDLVEQYLLALDLLEKE